MNWRGKLVNLDTIKKILVIQPKPFGDVLLTAAYLPALRRRFPDAQIDFLVFKPYDRMIYKHPSLSNIVAVRMRKDKHYTWDRLVCFYKVFRRRYDLVIDQNSSTTSAQIALFSGARYRLGYDVTSSRLFSNIKATYGPTKYNAAKRYDMLKPLGIDEEPIELFFYISPQAKAFAHDWLRTNNVLDKKIALFSPGATHPSKVWKIEYVAQLADLIVEKTELAPVIIWGPGEKQYVDRMVAAMRNQVYVLPATDIDQAAAFLERSAFHFCNDGGITHLSVATKTPTLAFYGVISPVAWSPQGYVPTHFHMFNREWDWRHDPERTNGYTAEDAWKRFKELAPKFGIEVYE